MIRYILGIHHKIIGTENIPRKENDQGVVVLSKHQSAWETIVLQIVFPPCVFVLKRVLFLIPGLGWGFWSLGMIGINRGSKFSAIQQVISQGKARLNAGINVVIFPEGTRIAPGKTKRFQTGGAQLAKKSHAFVIPVAHNAGELWPRNAFIKQPGTVTLSIGPPIDPTELTPKEINARAEAWINTETEKISQVTCIAS